MLDTPKHHCIFVGRSGLINHSYCDDKEQSPRLIMSFRDYFVSLTASNKTNCMKRIITSLLALLGLAACSQQGFENVEVDSFTTQSGKTVKIHALVHSSMRIDFDGTEIEIDPVSKLGEKTIDYTAMPKADYIFITHEHFDHLDTTAINTLTGENTQLITNQSCADILGYGTVMANGDILQLADDITVEAFPAYNTSEGHQDFHPKGRDNGFILTLDGLRIYIAADTEDIPEMANIKDIDIAFLPCNQPYTMTVDQLVNAAQMVKPKVLFPYHYGQTDVSGIPSQLEADGIEVRITHYE